MIKSHRELPSRLQLRQKNPKNTEVKIKIYITVLFLILIGSLYLGIQYYSYLFAREIKGEVVGIDRVTQPTAIINSTRTQIPASQIFSFAIAIKDSKGEIFTSSSEDRQWAVVEKGQCAEAKFFPYPPWELDKGGTYYGARLIKLYSCPVK